MGKKKEEEVVGIERTRVDPAPVIVERKNNLSLTSILVCCAIFLLLVYNTVTLQAVQQELKEAKAQSTPFCYAYDSTGAKKIGVDETQITRACPVGQ